MYDYSNIMRETVEKVQKKIKSQNKKHGYEDSDFLSYEKFANINLSIAYLADYINNWVKAADIAVLLYPKVESYNPAVDKSTKKLYRFSMDSPRKLDSYLHPSFQEDYNEKVRREKAEIYKRKLTN